MSTSFVLHNATLFDSATGELRPRAVVTIDGDKITDVRFGSSSWAVARASSTGPSFWMGTMLSPPSVP